MPPTTRSSRRFCMECGAPFGTAASSNGAQHRDQCLQCGWAPFFGPAVLVAVNVCAEGSILHVQRGEAPYVLQWAPVTGFVEPGECLEAAAVRELEEETGLAIPTDMMTPLAVVSVPEINQVYFAFVTVLPNRAPLRPRAPEVIAARWLSEQDYGNMDIWPPAQALHTASLFDHMRSGRFPFYQRSADFLRILRTTGQSEPLTEGLTRPRTKR